MGAMSDVPYLTYMALYVLSFHILQINSRTSTYWKLNPEEEKIVMGSRNIQITRKDLIDDPVFDIVTTTIHHGGKSWTRQPSFHGVCNPLTTRLDGTEGPKNTTTSKRNSTSGAESPPKVDSTLVSYGTTEIVREEDEDELDCGKAVNFTYYDNLVGVNNRHNHPLVPEPQVALIFKKKNSKFDVDALERKLKKAKREKPKSVQLYNQIGNFWRIKGDAQKSIECFRRALAVSPHNAEVLLNLARVLLNLQYLDDAIYLTRRSLEVQPPDKNAWQQYFTLGEIFKAYGHYQEASAHMRHSLELKPEFEPAIQALKAMDMGPETALRWSTICIIITLCTVVLGVLMLAVGRQQTTGKKRSQELLFENNNSSFGSLESKSGQKHFNRAMAMRSLKMGISSRSLRGRR